MTPISATPKVVIMEPGGGWMVPDSSTEVPVGVMEEYCKGGGQGV